MALLRLIPLFHMRAIFVMLQLKMLYPFFYFQIETSVQQTDLKLGREPQN